jgi:hypothetical protein
MNKADAHLEDLDMQVTQYKVKKPDGSFEVDEHGEVAVYSMGGTADYRLPAGAVQVTTRAVFKVKPNE